MSIKTWLSIKIYLVQCIVLRTKRPQALSRSHRVPVHPENTLSPLDSGEDRTLSPLHENLILLDQYHSPSEMEERTREWVDYYLIHRYHEANDNAMPAHKNFGRDQEILINRSKLKSKPSGRKKINRMTRLENLPNKIN